MSDYADRENVKKATSVLSKEDWNRIFPKVNAVYTYDSFLQAVAKFPAFCGETNHDNLDEK